MLLAFNVRLAGLPLSVERIKALLEALLRTRFDALAARAAEVRTAHPPREALVAWLRDFVACMTDYRGVVTSLVQAIEDPRSALHTSCVGMRTAGTELLTRAQEAHLAQADLDGADLFALASSLAWLADRPGHEQRAGHLFDVVMSAVLIDGGPGA